MCLGDGGENEKAEMPPAAAAAATTVAEAADSCSSDGDADGQDEAQYRITVPLDVRLAATEPVFAVAAATHPSMSASSVPPLLSLTPVVSHSHMPTAAPAAHSAVHPLMPLPPPPSHLHASLQQQQQLVLPASTAPAPRIIPQTPRCRDYDGESAPST